MSYKRVCDCCGRDLTRTLFRYELKWLCAMDNEDLCRECYYRIRDEIRNSTNQQKERIEE